MKSNPQMDIVLEKAESDPGYIRELIPVLQTFANYGGMEPYEHYITRIHNICLKWQGGVKMADIVPILTDAYVQFCHGAYSDAEQTILDLKTTQDLSIDPDHFALAEILTGISKRDKGDIDAALVHFLNAADALNEESSLPNFRSYAHYFIAEIHQQIDDFSTAGTHYKKALFIAEQTVHNTSLFRSLIGLGAWYQSQGEHNKSMKYFRRALNMETITDASRSRILRDMGTYYLELGELDEAISYLEKSYNLAMEQGYSNPASTCLIHLGQAYLQKQQPKKALEALNEAREISLSFHTRAKQMEIESLLASIYEQLGKVDLAYLYLKSASALKPRSTPKNSVRSSRLKTDSFMNKTRLFKMNVIARINSF